MFSSLNNINRIVEYTINYKKNECGLSEVSPNLIKKGIQEYLKRRNDRLKQVRRKIQVGQ